MTLTVPRSKARVALALSRAVVLAGFLGVERRSLVLQKRSCGGFDLTPPLTLHRLRASVPMPLRQQRGRRSALSYSWSFGDGSPALVASDASVIDARHV